METISNAVLSSWEINPWVLVPIAILGVIYTRGWWLLHRRAPDRFGLSQLAAFFAGLITIVVALLSPLDAFAGPESRRRQRRRDASRFWIGSRDARISDRADGRHSRGVQPDRQLNRG